MSILKREFPVPEGQYPPFAVVTDTDHAVWIIIVTALGMTCAFVFAGVRIFVRTTINPPFASDDFVLGAATVFAFVQSSVTLGACSKGLGKSIELVPLDDQSEVQLVRRMSYVGYLLFLIALGLSKLSITTLLLRLSPAKHHKMAFGVATGIIIAWMIASLFAIGLQCDLSHPAQSLGADCSGTFLRWQMICIFDMLTELSLFGLALYLVWSLEMSIWNKIRVVSGFCFRLLIVVPIAFRLATFSEAGYTVNPTFSQDYFIVWTQTELSFALMSATVPILKSFMKNLSTMRGGLGVDDTGYTYGSSATGSRARHVGNYQLSKLRSKLSSLHARSTIEDEDEETIMRSEFVESTPSQVDTGKRNTGTIGEYSAGRSGKADATSIDSAESRQMMIRKDVTWKINHEAR